jgi:hypothetical protein
MSVLRKTMAGVCQQNVPAPVRYFAACLGLLGAFVLMSASASAAGCYATPSACGYPDTTNTGVPAGTTLTPSGSITASTNGQVIDGKDITGSVTIAADNVTIRNSRVFTDNSGSTAVININDGADNFTLEDSEVGGNGSTTNAPESGVWNHYNNPGAQVIRSYIHGSPDNWEGRVDLVKDSYMVVDAALPGSHDENIYVWCTTVNVDHSTLINHHEQTATVFGDTLGCGGNDYTVTDSLLAGGGFTLYSQAAGESHSIPDAKTVVTGNRFARCLGTTKYNSGSGGTTCSAGPDSNGVFPYGGYFGLAAGFNGPTTWSGNVWDDNSQAVCVGGDPGCGGTTPPPPPPPPPADTPANAVWTAPTGATVGSPVTLKSASTGDAPLTCTWTFEDEDGTALDTRTGCQVSYTFQQTGTQYVRLSVTDIDGDTDSSLQSFSVAEATSPPPTDTPVEAVWTPPAEATVGVPVVLDGSASTGDADLSCTWSFENQSGSVIWETHEGCVIDFTFEQVDTKYVKLAVEDSDGEIDISRQSFPVAATTSPPPPPPADTPANAVWTAPTGATVGSPVTLKSASTGDAPLTCLWSFENQSGSLLLDTRTGCQVSYTFQQAGAQYVRLTVTDADGDTDFSRKSFSVAEEPSSPPPPTEPPEEEEPGSGPTAHALWSAPATARLGQRITLDGTASQGSRPLRCVWTIENSSGSRVSERKYGCRTSYRFRQAGTQYIRLTIRANDGQTDTLQRSIRVSGSTSFSGGPVRAASVDLPARSYHR